jgi:hypothetical protein
VPNLTYAQRRLKLFCRTRVEIFRMAKLVFGMNQSLDGYVDHMAFAPDPPLFRHFVERMRDLTGSVYGRCLYEVMRYWTKTILSGTRRNATSPRPGALNRSGLRRAR